MRALSRYSASVTLAPKASQLFQPIGGAGAQAWKGSPGSAVREAVADAPAAGMAAAAARLLPTTAHTKPRRPGCSGKLLVEGVAFMRMDAFSSCTTRRGRYR